MFLELLVILELFMWYPEFVLLTLSSFWQEPKKKSKRKK
jgi:hypothetical protein